MHASHETARCPICDERTDRRILEKNVWLEEAVVAALRESHPQWVQSDGACLRCVTVAVSEIAHSDKRGKLQFEGAVPAGIGRWRAVLSLQARIEPDLHFQGRRVTVAVIDSDFVAHPDFTKPRNRIVTYVNAACARPIDDATPPAPYLGSWHGTMVAGAAFGNGYVAGGKYPGIAPKASLVFVRIAPEDLRIGELQVLRGLRWVLANREKYQIRIVNMSVGGDRPAKSTRNALDRLVARAVRAGIVVVAAAGNRHGEIPVAPASAPEAISVGGIDDHGGAGRLQIFPGAHGPTLDGIQKPDLLAPAKWIPAPMVPGTPQTREAELLLELDSLPDDRLVGAIARRFHELSLPEDIVRRPAAEIRARIAARRENQKFITIDHQHVDGTSFAAAITSAVVAQMLEANPDLSPAEVKNILMETAVPLPGEPLEKQGAGVLNAAAAVRAAFEQRVGRLPQFDSPHVSEDGVLYHYFDPTDRAASVEWLGSLGGWKPHAMRKVAPGLWICQRPRPVPGRYAYKFLLADGRFAHDRANPLRDPDGFGGWNSVLEIRRSRGL
jgi:serine protease AprX